MLCGPLLDDKQYKNECFHTTASSHTQWPRPLPWLLLAPMKCKSRISPWCRVSLIYSEDSDWRLEKRDSQWKCYISSEQKNQLYNQSLLNGTRFFSPCMCVGDKFPDPISCLLPIPIYIFDLWKLKWHICKWLPELEATFSSTAQMPHQSAIRRLGAWVGPGRDRALCT